MNLSVKRGSKRVRKWHKQLRVFLNGKDVTKRCIAFHTKQGWADLFMEHPDGGLLVKDGEVVKRRVHGWVRMEWIDEVP